MWSAELVIIESQRRIIKKNTDGRRGRGGEFGGGRMTRLPGWISFATVINKAKQFPSLRQKGLNFKCKAALCPQCT